jgi:exodeoxyribonuclease-3
MLEASGMEVLTFNLNGLRAAVKKGLLSWVAERRPDILCFQETRCQAADRTEALLPAGYHCYFADAKKKGYSGTALLCKAKPDEVYTGWGLSGVDDEGRFVAARFGELWVASLYVPSGSAGPHRQAAKDTFLEQLGERLKAFGESPLAWLVCCDMNIAHKPADLKNWRSNEGNSGFLPHERAFMDRATGEWKMVDAFRRCNQEEGQYTWWSNRGRAWESNTGWRIDYHLCNPRLAPLVQSAEIFKTQRFSDHAPLLLRYGPSSAKLPLLLPEGL